MDTETAGTIVLLKHNPEYGVLVCLKCHYAVQRSALDSHLLRHKIYRDKRKRLVASVSHLEILEPDEVSVPAPTSQALDHITKFSGLKCTVQQCGHLTVSMKRMKLHWKQAHDSPEFASNDLARDVTLQTFFRGNKVRYFEVESAHTPDPRSSQPDTAAHRGSAGLAELSSTHDEEAPSTISTRSPNNSPAVADEPDLCLLRYFHHFVTATSNTLPFRDEPSSEELYWEEIVVSTALQHHWLMHGLLAISACHMAVSTDDPVGKDRHCRYAAQYTSKFESRVEEPRSDEVMEQMAIYVRCLLHMAQIGLHQTISGGAKHPPNDRSISVSLRDCLFLDNIGLGYLSPMGGKASTRSDVSAEVPLGSLRTLQSRMFELLGRPDNVSDALTIIKSIDLLTEACNSTAPHSDIEVCWNAAAAWLKHVPKRFHAMVEDLDTVALLVMAYWSSTLVSRVERQGCWFLKGVVKASVLQIAEKLIVERHPLLPLILDFGST